MVGRMNTAKTEQFSMPFLPGLTPPRGLPRSDIHGFVERINFSDVERGYLILSVRADNGDLVTVCGHGDAVSVGSEIHSDGKWEPHPKFGRQFNATFISSKVPETREGIVAYLSRGAVDGVGKKSAEKLAAYFGEKLPDVILSPTVLASSGVPESKTRLLSNHWEIRTKYAWLLTLLYSHGLGPATADKIIRKYGDSATKIVANEPYRLAEEVHGIGFKTADRIALSQGIALDASARVHAGILYVMMTSHRSGHCAQPVDVVIEQAVDLLQVPRRLVEEAAVALKNDKKIVEDEIGGRAVLYSASIYACEVDVAEDIISRIEPCYIPEDLDHLIDAIAAENGIILDILQRNAVVMAIANRTCIITGPPGTGKTAIVKIIIKVLEAIDPDIRIALAALVGRAARRIEESTGHPASTIHKLLEWSPAPPRGFKRNSECQLAADAATIDEFSMNDIWLTRDVLRALPREARLIIVGDKNQLPSIGPGNVLADLVDSGAVPVTHLTKNYRSGLGSSITVAAERINKGYMPDTTSPRRSSDMWGIFLDDPKEIVDKIVKMMTEVMPSLGYDPLTQVQIVSPGHEHDTGTKNLNRVVQDCVNPLQNGEPAIRHHGWEFRLRDRVIHTKNNKDLETYNGEIGNIVDLSAEPGEESITIEYDGERTIYDRSDFDQIDLAYAVTIHKLQGSEFPFVITVCTTQHYIMLCRHLIYTGITRARQRSCVIGSKRAVSIAIKTIHNRLTGLAQRIAGKAIAAPHLPPSP